MATCEHGYTENFDCPICTCPICGLPQDQCPPGAHAETDFNDPRIACQQCNGSDVADLLRHCGDCWCCAEPGSYKRLRDHQECGDCGHIRLVHDDDWTIGGCLACVVKGSMCELGFLESP